jgi:hypothetical protein
MSNPIDSSSGATGPQGTSEAGATEDAGSVEEAADAFRAAVEGAVAAPELSPMDGLTMEIAGQMQAGELDPHQAAELLLEGMVEQRFAALDPTARRAMAVDVRTALMDDSYFMMEVDQLLGAALERVG